MHLVGPFPVRLAFHVFVVVVGMLILSGAVNTAIVGSNGVLNRVSEDGVLSEWFRHPQRRFGTSYRIINIVVAAQIVTIIIEPRRCYVSGEPVCLWRDLEFRAEGRGGPGSALYASAGSRLSRAVQLHGLVRNSSRPGIHYLGVAGHGDCEFLYQARSDHSRRCFYLVLFWCLKFQSTWCTGSRLARGMWSWINLIWPKKAI